LAAALDGAPISTFDVDILHSREPANVRRLLGALGKLEASFAHNRNGAYDPRNRTWRGPAIST
jgi:hypothetical protein